MKKNMSNSLYIYMQIKYRNKLNMAENAKRIPHRKQIKHTHSALMSRRRT